VVGFTCSTVWESVFEGYVALLSHTWIIAQQCEACNMAYGRAGVQEIVLCAYGEGAGDVPAPEFEM